MLSNCLRASFVSVEKSVVHIRLLLQVKNLFHLLISRFSPCLCLSAFLLWCVYLWSSLYLFCLKFEFPIWVVFKTNLRSWNFSHSFFENVFLIFLSPLLQHLPSMCVGVFNGAPHFSESLFIFLHFFSSSVFQLA